MSKEVDILIDRCIEAKKKAVKLSNIYFYTSFCSSLTTSIVNFVMGVMLVSDNISIASLGFLLSGINSIGMFINFKKSPKSYNEICSKLQHSIDLLRRIKVRNEEDGETAKTIYEETWNYISRIDPYVNLPQI